MGKYVEKNLGKNETIVRKADLNGLFLLSSWISGILFCWLIVPLIKAIIATIKFNHIELAITSKRIVGKTGVFNTNALDAPLNKVQSVKVTQSFFGKIFNFSTIIISTAAGEFSFGAIKNGDAFKGVLMSQIDQFEEDRLNEQATKMANAMAGAINK